MLQTGDRCLAEAPPCDAIWGIGLSVADAKKGLAWRVTNLLGKAPMRVRDELRSDRGCGPREPGFTEFKRLVGTLGVLPGEPVTAARRLLVSSVLEHHDANPTGASSHEESFAAFEVADPRWRRRTAPAPPHIALGAHAIGASASDWRLADGPARGKGDRHAHGGER